MGKEVINEVIRDYGEIDLDDDISIKIAEIKWNGRQQKGYDIRKYYKSENKFGKGITIPYDDIEKIIEIFIKNNLCNLNKLEKIIKKQKESLISNDDLNFRFEKMNYEMEKYTRDKYGKLRDDENRIVITSRKRKKKG